MQCRLKKGQLLLMMIQLVSFNSILGGQNVKPQPMELEHEPGLFGIQYKLNAGSNLVCLYFLFGKFVKLN